MLIASDYATLNLMKLIDSRSNCPIAKSLDIFGDRWSLLIVRSMLFAKRKTFKELSEIDESIATNILADRLERLEQTGIIIRLSDPTDGRRFIYELTEKGIDLISVLLSIIDWGMKYNTNAIYPADMVKHAVRNKNLLIEKARKLQLPQNQAD